VRRSRSAGAIHIPHRYVAEGGDGHKEDLEVPCAAGRSEGLGGQEDIGLVVGGLDVKMIEPVGDCHSVVTNPTALHHLAVHQMRNLNLMVPDKSLRYVAQIERTSLLV
jgi:hypothetical protein